jgi:biotin operon repressor
MLRPAEGAYSHVPVCRPAEWLRAVELALQQSSVERLMRSRRRGRAQILAVAGRLAAAADFETGRNVAVSFQTIADALHCSPATVKKCVQFLSHLGFHIEVCHGRDLLTLDELAAARAMGAEDQRAVASTRYLTIPAWARALIRMVRGAVSSAPLHAHPEVKEEPSVSEKSPTRASASKAAATRPPAGMKKPTRRNAGTRTSSAPPRPLPLQRFAARLIGGDERDAQPRRLPWLLRGAAGRRDRHIGSLCDILTAAGVDVARWRPRELIEAIDSWHHAASRATVPPGAQLNPLRYFAWQLEQLDQAAPTPTELAERRKAERAAECQRRAAERRAEQEHINAIDQAEVDRIIAQMKLDAAASSDRLRRALRSRSVETPSTTRSLPRSPEGRRER